MMGIVMGNIALCPQLFVRLATILGSGVVFHPNAIPAFVVVGALELAQLSMDHFHRNLAVTGLHALLNVFGSSDDHHAFLATVNVRDGLQKVHTTLAVQVGSIINNADTLG